MCFESRANWKCLEHLQGCFATALNTLLQESKSCSVEADNTSRPEQIWSDYLIGKGTVIYPRRPYLPTEVTGQSVYSHVRLCMTVCIDAILYTWTMKTNILSVHMKRSHEKKEKSESVYLTTYLSSPLLLSAIATKAPVHVSMAMKKPLQTAFRL